MCDEQRDSRAFDASCVPGVPRRASHHDRYDSDASNVRTSCGMILLAQVGSECCMLCVQQHVSYTFRYLLYRISRLAVVYRAKYGIMTRELRRSDVDEMCRIVSELSPREYGIVMSSDRFEIEMWRIYVRSDRKRFARGLLSMYAALRPCFTSVRPDVRANERRWSPPKGLVMEDESYLAAAEREVHEETGLCRNDYNILSDDAVVRNTVTRSDTMRDTYDPAIVEYEVDGKRHRLILYFGTLSNGLFQLFDAGNALHNVPKPVARDEIARAAMIPIQYIPDYMPLQYGDALYRMIRTRLQHTAIGR